MEGFLNPIRSMSIRLFWWVCFHIQGSWYCQPKQCTIVRKSHNIPIYLHCLTPPKMGNLMIPDIARLPAPSKNPRNVSTIQVKELFIPCVFVFSSSQAGGTVGSSSVGSSRHAERWAMQIRMSGVVFLFLNQRWSDPWVITPRYSICKYRWNKWNQLY